MTDSLEVRVAAVCGVSSARRLGTLQSLWQGYGEAVRLQLSDGRRVVVKDVRPPSGSGFGHRRKLRSYDVESTFYADWAPRSTARVAQALALEAGERSWLLVLEDLDAVGFTGRPRRLSARQLRQCLDWLARFHAGFLGEDPTGLWARGTYWHLATRPDEWSSMAAGPLKRRARDLDRVLEQATHRTLVHGDAKPANFVFGPDGVAAVDFQYVGGGIGTQDVAYLLRGADRAAVERALAWYFEALRGLGVGEEVCEEWRALFVIAWADYERFLEGWAPGAWHSTYSDEVVARGLRMLEDLA